MRAALCFDGTPLTRKVSPFRWHWSQPVAFLLVFWTYFCRLGPTQVDYFLVVAVREVLYIATTLASVLVCPAYLLLDISTVWAETDSTVKSCWRLAIYILTPHNYVALCLAARFSVRDTPRSAILSRTDNSNSSHRPWWQRGHWIGVLDMILMPSAFYVFLALVFASATWRSQHKEIVAVLAVMWLMIVACFILTQHDGIHRIGHACALRWKPLLVFLFVVLFVVVGGVWALPFGVSGLLVGADDCIKSDTAVSMNVFERQLGLYGSGLFFAYMSASVAVAFSSAAWKSQHLEITVAMAVAWLLAALRFSIDNTRLRHIRDGGTSDAGTELSEHASFRLNNLINWTPAAGFRGHSSGWPSSRSWRTSRASLHSGCCSSSGSSTRNLTLLNFRPACFGATPSRPPVSCCSSGQRRWWRPSGARAAQKQQIAKDLANG
eukprot:SAG22_NODE_2610_length_2383_cov_1.477671_2_plen_436_part_00